MIKVEFQLDKLCDPPHRVVSVLLGVSVVLVPWPRGLRLLSYPSSMVFSPACFLPTITQQHCSAMVFALEPADFSLKS